MWEYRATPINVVDGDTFDATVDLGFSVSLNMRLRLLGIDTPEPNGDTRDAGIAAQVFTNDWLMQHADQNGHILITTIADRRQRDKRDSFGRYLAMVWNIAKSANLNEALIAAGHSTGRFE